MLHPHSLDDQTQEALWKLLHNQSDVITNVYGTEVNIDAGRVYSMEEAIQYLREFHSK